MKMIPQFASLLLGGSLVAAIDVTLTDASSIKSTAASLAYEMMTYYSGNRTGGIVGVLPGPPPNPQDGYYWWESGAMWGTLIDYWHYTGDSSYNDVLSKGVQHQIGDDKNMMPKNWTQSMGNDDQGFWGMTVLSMAETNFPAPPSDIPDWLALAQGVYNSQVPRIDNTTCGGGLHWQVYQYNTGFNYKNAIASGCLFNMAARLARYTNNDTYAQVAAETFDWVYNVGYISKDYHVYDGAHVEYNCTDINKVEFSYNNAIFLLGAAVMYNYTNGAEIWRTRVDGLLKTGLEVFFPKGIAYEVSCEAHISGCTTDMLSFKAYLTRWYAATTQMAPYTLPTIMPVLKTSAEAAAKQCVGGTTGQTCGLSWSSGVWDGTKGVGQQMSAMSAVFTNLLPLEEVGIPLTNATGGTSKGDPGAGGGAINPQAIKPATKADRAGAGILTTLILVVITGLFGWMSI